MFAKLLACSLTALLIANTPAALDPTVTVGDPHDPGKLPQEITDAYRGGAHRIVIRTGIYRLPATGHPAIVLLSWKEGHLSGHGVTLVSSETSGDADLIRLVNCSKVEIDDLTFSQADSIAYQGKFSNGAWKPDTGYPLPAKNLAHFQIVDGPTRNLKGGEASLTSQGDGTFQCASTQAVNGDWLVAPTTNFPPKIHLIDCRECIISDATLLRNGADAISEERGGGNSFYDCHWQSGPKPEGATEKPLVTCSGRGFHSIAAYPGPDIEECDFTGVVLGDGIVVGGTYESVKSISGTTLTLNPGPTGLVVGQPIRISASGFFAGAYVKTVTKNGDGSLTVELDQNLPIPSGAKVSNPLMNGQSFKVLNCHLGNTVGCGVVASGDSGFIENNLIVGCGRSAISVGPDPSQNLADYLQNLTVKSNQLKGNGFASKGNPAILLHGNGAIGNKTIDIEQNTFDGNFSGDISIQDASLVAIKNNNFASPSKRAATFERPIPISLTRSNSIRVLDNLMKNDLLYAKPWIQSTSDVTGLDQQDGRGLKQ